MRIMHVIAGLGVGGAETQLSLLALEMAKRGHDTEVVTLLSGGENAEKLVANGIDVQTLNMRRGVPDPIAIARFNRKIKTFRPDIIQSWLYHADMLSLIESIINPTIPRVWNIRCSKLVRKDHGLLLFSVIRCLGFLSKSPDAVVANSHAGKDFHVCMGYQPKRWEIISNGIDTEIFKPSESARSQIKNELGLSDEAILVGHVARYHPMKDHETLVAAASSVIFKQKNVHFVLVGPGVDMQNKVLRQQIESTGVSNNFHLLGSRKDTNKLQASWDVAVCSSYSEGFPNTLAEAMSCEIPCVGTDVGDVRILLTGAGFVVAPSDPELLGNAITELLSLPLNERKSMGRVARSKILAEYSVKKCADHYLALYESCIRKT